MVARWLALLTAAPAFCIAGGACSTDSEFGACGYGAQLQTRYACEGNVAVVTQENCPPKEPTVTRKDCAASGDQCLQMIGLPTASGEKLFMCARPCLTNADCPVDFYCAGGLNSTADGRTTCTASLREGFACSPSIACASGLLCANNTAGGTSDPGAQEAGSPDAATPIACQPTTLDLPDEALGKYDCSCQRP